MNFHTCTHVVCTRHYNIQRVERADSLGMVGGLASLNLNALGQKCVVCAHAHKKSDIVIFRTVVQRAKAELGP